MKNSPSICLLFSFLAAFCLAGCQDSSQTESGSSSATSEAAAQPKGPVAVTSGRVNLVDLPTEGKTAIEVIIVSTLEPETARKVNRQRALYEKMLLGEPEETLDDITLPDEQLAPYQARLDALKLQFPSIISKELNTGGGRMVNFSSDAALHKDYAYLFNAVTLKNFERALPVLKDKIEATNKDLVEKGNLAEGDALYQAQINVEWVAALAKLFGEYIQLGNEFMAVEAEYLKTYLTAHGNEPLNWKDFSAYYRATLFAQVAQHSQGAALADADGNFEVEGQGMLIVRVEYGLDSVYFIIDETEQRVKVDGLREWERNEAE